MSRTRKARSSCSVGSPRCWSSITGCASLEEAIVTAVKLSHRYIPARQLPDKAVGLLDTACARVAIAQNATPAPLEDCGRRIDHLNVELGILERERAAGGRHDQRIDDKQKDLASEQARLGELTARWDDERKRVDEIRELARTIEGRYAEEKQQNSGDGQLFQPTAELAALQADLEAKFADLRKLQGESPLMKVFVDSQTIAEVVAGWTGIPVGKMLTDEINLVLGLRARLEERVIGQSHALEAISQRIRTSRASLTDPRRPVGVFLLVGPAVSARRRPRWRWPRPSTAASVI